MSRPTQAEILIMTLKELRDAERERETARLRLQYKAHAERFMKAFRPDQADSVHRPHWTPPGNGAAQEAALQMRNE